MNTTCDSPIIKHGAAAAVGNTPKRILVVDDDPAILRLIVAALAGNDRAIESAADGEEAWQVLQTKAYDLLVTDHLMPKVSGLALVRRIRVARISIPVIVVSGTLETVDLPRDPWSRVDGFVRKPFTLFELQAVVDSFVPVASRAPQVPVFSLQSHQR